MNTFLLVVFVVLGFAGIAYLFSAADDFARANDSACSSEDYEIAEKIANKKN